MEILLSSSLFISGLFILIVVSDWLIQSSVKLSLLFRLTPLFIGLVLVAFGTSAPEAGVGIVAVIKNQKAIALGTVVGSNIANIALILGFCSLITPLNVKRTIFKREFPFLLLAASLLYIVSLDLLISRLEGLFFIIFFIIFLLVSYRGAKKSFDLDEINDFEFKKLFKSFNSRFIIFIFALLSLVGVVIGADLMVRGGISLAKIFKVSPWIIAMTIFAVGTSLPEFAASLAASFKKIHSISVGNIVGSNIFNILFILGVVSLIRPISVEFSVLKFELPALIIFSFLLFTVMITKYKISRWEGLVLFLGYLGFLTLLFLKSV